MEGRTALFDAGIEVQRVVPLRADIDLMAARPQVGALRSAVEVVGAARVHSVPST